MKIEKLNDNQIRCTLTREDLARRNLKMSELAYGSEKTKDLFREMVQEADFEYGFETDNMPLVVEAIPMNTDCLVLIITKVDDPEELDTRFSRFSAPGPDADSDSDYDDLPFSDSDAPVPMAPSFSDMLKDALAEETPTKSFIFGFNSLSAVMDFAVLAGSYPGDSRLYKISNPEEYLLQISVGSATKDDFKKVCQLASEYGNGRSVPASSGSYFEEHYDILIGKDAIKKLSGK